MILVTGGAGFIGSNFVLDWLAQRDEPVLNLDALTYAGNMENFAALDGDARHVFVHGDICDRALLDRLLAEYRPRALLHFAAESHVDRSIHGPGAFVRTNVEGTFTLLEAARAYWGGLPPAEREAFRFHHVSTDEVYGSLGADDPAFTETHPYQPNSPYSASKAASDHLVRAWFHTYGLAGADHQLLQQLRPLPLSGKADPADDRQRAGGQAAADLRRWAERARLALRQGPLQRHSRGAGAGAAGRGLQHRRLERDALTGRSSMQSVPCSTSFAPTRRGRTGA